MSRPKEESRGGRRLPKRLAITGLGIDTSAGEAIIQTIADMRRSSLDCIMINNGDEYEKMQRVERYCERYNTRHGDLLRPATLDEICMINDRDDAWGPPADMVLLTAGLGLGASRGNFTTEMPPDIRRFLFNLNIRMVRDMARKFAAYGNDLQRHMIFTNPCDSIGFYFAREFWEERNRRYNAGEYAGLLAPDPFRHSITAFNNADSSRARIEVSDYLNEKFPGNDFDLDIKVVGPHDGRLVLSSSISTVTYGQGKKRVTKSLDHFLDSESLEVIRKKIAKFAWFELNDMGSAALSMAESFVSVYDAMCDGMSEVELSVPYTFDRRDIFFGLRVRFDPELYAVVDDKFMKALSIDALLGAISRGKRTSMTPDQAAFIRSASSMVFEMDYLEDRQGKLKKYFYSKDIGTDIAQDPKFFAELAVPVRIKENGVSQEWLYFYNCTEPHTDFTCVRDPIPLNGHPSYIEAYVKDGKRFLMLCNEYGVDIVDPESRQQASLLEIFDSSRRNDKNWHVNGCCLVGDTYIASSNDDGLFWSKGGELKEMVIQGEVPGNFIGNVKSVGKKIYFSTDSGIVEAEVEGNTATVTDFYEVSQNDELTCNHEVPQKVHNFCAYKTQKGLELLVTTGPERGNDGKGFVYRFKEDKSHESLFDNDTENLLPDLRHVKVAYVFDKMHAVITSKTGVSWVPLQGKKQGGKKQIEEIKNFRLRDVVASSFGGIFMLSSYNGKLRRYDANRVYHVSDAGYHEGPAPRLHLSPLCDNRKISHTMYLFEAYVPLPTEQEK